MHIKKTCGRVLTKTYDSLRLKGLLDIYIPETHKSTIWKYWRAILDPKLIVFRLPEPSRPNLCYGRNS